MGEALEIAKVLVSPVMKLMDMVRGALGILYEPRHKRKMTDATVYEINSIGEVMRKYADLPVVYNQDGVAITSEDFNRLMRRAGTRLVLQETIKQHNIENVVDNAYEILENEEVCSDEPVEQGWINRFFDSVADVSDEDLQTLWAKILAGEIKKPKSYSLRTLDVLRNLSKEEALTFNKLQPLILKQKQKGFIVSNEEVLKKYGINYEDLLLLEDCGLLFLQKSKACMDIHQDRNQIFLEYHKTLIGFSSKSKQSEKIQLGVYCLTTAGVELSSLVDEQNEDYISEVVEKLSKNDNLELTIFKVKDNSNDQL